MKQRKKTKAIEPHAIQLTTWIYCQFHNFKSIDYYLWLDIHAMNFHFTYNHFNDISLFLLYLSFDFPIVYLFICLNYSVVRHRQKNKQNARTKKKRNWNCHCDKVEVYSHCQCIDCNVLWPFTLDTLIYSSTIQTPMTVTFICLFVCRKYFHHVVSYFVFDLIWFKVNVIQLNHTSKDFYVSYPKYGFNISFTCWCTYKLDLFALIRLNISL